MTRCGLTSSHVASCVLPARENGTRCACTIMHLQHSPLPWSGGTHSRASSEPEGRVRAALRATVSRRNLPQWRPEQIRPSRRRLRPRRPPRLRPLRHLRPRLTQPPPPPIILGRIHPRPSKPRYKLASSDPVQVKNSLGDCPLA